MNFKLSPSDLTFLYNGCKRCFYLKVARGISQPSIPLPSIFTQIAALLKKHYDGKQTSELHDALPHGTIILGEKFVRSVPITLANHASSCYISGRFDVVARFDDGTYGVIDFKTGNPDSESSGLYCRQLQAYAYALEHPAPRALSLAPVTKLGLLYFHPSTVKQDCTEKLLYEAEIKWVGIDHDESAFLSFIDEVLGVLESDGLPEPSDRCGWCRYMDSMKGI